MEGLFEAETAKRRRLPPNIRRLIVDLKAEYPPFNLNEIASVVGACFGRKIDVRSVRRVLNEEALPLKMGRNDPRYHEMEDSGERRTTIVELRVEGWSAKAIASYLDIHRYHGLPGSGEVQGGRYGRAKRQTPRAARRGEEGGSSGY